MNKKVKKNHKIPPVDVVSGRWFKQKACDSICNKSKLG